MHLAMHMRIRVLNLYDYYCLFRLMPKIMQQTVIKIFYFLLFCSFVGCSSQFRLSKIEGINVKDFGAIGDGIIDDSKAILATIEYALSVNKNFVYIPKGMYMMNSPLSVPSNFIIMGQKGETFILRGKNNLDHQLVVRGKSNVDIKNIGFIGNKINMIDILPKLYRSYSYAAFIKESKYVKFENVTFSNLLSTGIRIANSDDIEIMYCDLSNIGLDTGIPSSRAKKYSYNGILITADSTKTTERITIVGSNFVNIGLSMESKESVRGLNYHNDGDGIQISKKGLVNKIVINDCRFDGCGRRGIKIQTGKNISISNNIFLNSRTAIGLPMNSWVEDVVIKKNIINNCVSAILPNSSGIGKGIKNFKIDDNVVSNVNYFLYTAGTSFVTGNIGVDDSEPSIFYSTIKNNRITGLSNYFILGDLRNTLLSNNKIFNFKINSNNNRKRALITFKNGSSRVVLQRNIFRSKKFKNKLVEVRKKANNIYFMDNNKVMIGNDMNDFTDLFSGPLEMDKQY